MASVLDFSPFRLEDVNGAIDPARAFTVGTTYPNAFFDRNLRHRAEPVLDGPSSR